MSSGDITRYVVTIKFHEDNLSEINELNNHFTRAGFLLTLTDDDGKVHELGTNTFGLISAMSEEEVKAQSAALAESALDKQPEITVSRWETWQTEQQKAQ
ncbi:type V toxin-antitoxin system endoribonuclease antitoxin GhoS [Enterobacter sp.]|uniref:type V toxin-antitoxin system endoribonuclease antitoxin GhoS n=1 Tax=Enterobacter sp. TaxID=42895 RepID=UPI00296EF32D|nr:type V toxin-antitoxin system endoribonuclease antitoxin GhoS [Enterobacter sp.]